MRSPAVGTGGSWGIGEDAERSGALFATARVVQAGPSWSVWRRLAASAQCRLVNVEALIEPVRGVAWACRPHDAPSARAADLISDRPNRWNAEGEATIYLSGDAALALIEAGRHPEDLQASSRLYRVELRLPRALDIRRADVRTALDLPSDPAWTLDRERTRAVGGRVRALGACEGLLVPSAGALDQVERWNAVVFADDRDGIARLMGDPGLAGVLIFDEQ